MLKQHTDPGAGTPAWIAHDKKVLRFFAYFQEPVHERREEQSRTRNVCILYYLDDQTVHVIEPKQPNSGIPQGTLIRRHRIKKNNGYLVESDFKLGEEITIYAKTFKITGCDDFTREFLHLPPAEKPILVPSRVEPRKETKLRQFLANDPKVLRFYCVWDDTTSMFGDVRDMVLLYYLADDTIEIQEHVSANSGRQTKIPSFIRRGKVPKRRKQGAIDTVQANPDAFWTSKDLIVGEVINIYGRPFLLCDCDEFTKQYYAKFNITFTPIAYHSLNEDPIVHEEHYETKQKNFDYDDVLRFAIVLNTEREEDKERRFVMSYYVQDSTIQIFERPQRNSGFIGGKFMERQKVDIFNLLFVGSEIEINSFKFIIIAADEHAKEFMQKIK